MPPSIALTALLACPRCDGQPLESAARGHRCKACRTSFPALEGIPWLFAEPQAALGEWRERLNRLLRQLEYEAQSLERELAADGLHALTRRRLEHLRASYTDHARRLRALLVPLGLGALRASHETYLALRTRLPARQGLTTYYVNVHRDWAWGSEENEASFRLVADALSPQPPGKLLVLGAGACRLAYDLHMRCAPELSVALDVNPLLLLLAQKIMRGESVELYEFPIAPKGIDDHALLRSLAADQRVREGFHLVLADALRPPFMGGVFDTVVTPWLIDILSEDLRAFAPRVNALLAPGGSWINFGSLAFAHEAHVPCYSLEEVEALVQQAGFAAPQVGECLIPYMCSPSSRHGRRERAVAFRAVKRVEVRPIRHHALPDWLVEGEAPVPLLPSFQVQATSTRIHSFIMSLVDGRRSLQDMAQVLAEQRLMTREEALPALRSFLIKMYEETLRSPNF